MKRTFFLIGSILILVVAFVVYNQYTKPHRSVAGEKAMIITAVQLFDEFEQNETHANEKYLDKVIAVTGKVSEVGTNLDHKPIVMLETKNIMFGVRCTMADSTLVIEPGSTITIKGICTGYLSDVVMTNGLLVTAE